MGMSPNHVVQRNFPPMPLITCG
uniref:Uncharacterized protein n=1 Tax=Arundo donax TaxID=35708 RepID=A0A0A8ZXA0_ARUDO